MYLPHFGRRQPQMQHTEPAKQQTDLLQSTETEITMKLICLVIDLGDGIG